MQKQEKRGKDLMNTRKNAGNGERQTFVVDIIARQKCTWQGQIHWIQEDKKILFRSVMEMLRLMDSALSAGNGQQETDMAEEK